MRNFFIPILQGIVFHVGVSQHADHLHYYEIGDTLTVLAKSGLSLRDSHFVESKTLTSMPFGSKVIALESPRNWEVRDGRQGFWMKVKFGNQEGYAFSGYLSRLVIPKFEVDPVYFCSNLQWFETLARANTDSLIYIGNTLNEGHDWAGKDGSRSQWEVYKNGMIIHTVEGYESTALVIETSVMTMNDVLNFLEYYVFILREKCSDKWYMKEEERLEIVTTRSDYHIEEIKCEGMNFTARNVGIKNIIQFGLYGS